MRSFDRPIFAHFRDSWYGCGFEMQEAGTPTRVIQARMGITDIRHIVKYTALSADAFKSVTRQRVNAYLDLQHNRYSSPAGCDLKKEQADAGPILAGRD